MPLGGPTHTYYRRQCSTLQSMPHCSSRIRSQYAKNMFYFMLNHVICIPYHKQCTLLTHPGDCVYLQPAESGISPYICRIMDMFQPPQPPSLPFPAVHLTDTPTDTPTQNKQEITVSWYYRPQELDLDGDLLIYENEIFSSDDTTSISPDSIIGKCYVITPAEYCRMTSTPRNLQKMQNTFLCSKKYIPSEGRVVPLDSSGEVEMTQLPRKFLLRNKLVFPLYRQRQLEPVGPSTTTPALATSHAGGGAPRTLSHSKRGRAPTKTPAPTIAAPATTAATTAATTVTAATAPSGRRSPSRRRRKTREQYSPEPFPAWHAGLSLPITTQQAVSAADAAHPSPPGSALGGPIESGEMAAAAAGGGGGGGRTPTFGGSGTPRSRAGRWSQERYDAAQRSLVNILRSLGAINAHKAILRPTLRDEARKVRKIGYINVSFCQRVLLLFVENRNVSIVCIVHFAKKNNDTG